ncbi:MAG: type I-C CRISPR-associated protein Cas8c/Csd1 [Candidatus Omnitrophica bacterium]|nr:type I-C CRISPR-associated protein Cas8c/Csd1 [Candidatus Omnitrophota bacterium]
MIIQALNDHYKQLKDNPQEDIPALGFSREKVQFEFILNPQGQLLQVNDLRDENRASKLVIVPEAVKRSVNIAANFLCDNTGYVLGRDSEDKEKEVKDPSRGKKTFKEFKYLHHKIGDNIEDIGMKAVLSFIDSWNPNNLETSMCWSIWKELASSKIVFRLDNERRYIHERPTVKEAWLDYYKSKDSEIKAFCLVTGKKISIARLHNSIKGVKNSQLTGADIISCNLPAFCSYAKEQSYNAPISEEAMFNYTTLLNYFLRKESRQKVQIGDATTVFWAEGETPIIGFLKDILDPREISPDVTGLRLFLEAVRDGRKPELSGTENLKFYILGLSPNAKRLSVRFWHVSTVDDISRKIGQHFSDLSIKRDFEDKQPEYPGIWQLLHVTAVQGKKDNISPVLAGSVMRSILTGAVYPRALLTATLERIRAEQDVGYLRACLIKAYLLRRSRIHKNKTKEVGMVLDKEKLDNGYLLGRLFAVLEKAQKDAIPGANTTIKDRFYGSASATPSVVFPQLMRLAQHHIQKSSFGTYLDKMIEEIICNLKIFPSHLSLEKQGMFALGYYHQKQELYKKTEKTEKKEEE